MYGIRVKRFEADRVRVRYVDAFRVRLEVVAAKGFDGRVFVFSRSPVDPYSGRAVDQFEGVVGPREVDELPVDAPDVRRGWPYYRATAVELDFASTAEADDVWALIRGQLGTLIAAMERNSQLALAEEVEFGDDTGSESP